VPDRFDRHCHFKRMKLHADEDWVSIYDGREGSGKSTGAIWDAQATSGDLFDMHEHICYDPEEFMRLVDDCPRFGTLILDEAGEAFFSRSFRDNINVTIAKTLQQMRYRNLNVILCVPHKDYIDLIGRVRARSWTHFDANRRGRAEFMMPFRGKYYSRDEPFWKTQFFYQFSALPKAVYDDYKVLKEAKSRERLGRYIDEVEKKKEKASQITIEDVMEQIKAHPDSKEMVNRSGNYDPDIIHYRLGVSFPLARAAARKLKSPSLII
jgi:hypothetical protein